MTGNYLSDWDFTVSLLPEGWREKMRELGLLKFGRKFTGPDKEERLLRVLLMHLAQYGEQRERAVSVYAGEREIKGRICVMKKSPRAAEKARRELLIEAKKKQRNTSDKTLELAGYILIFTTLDAERFGRDFILHIYRLRRQLEVLFKRLKSILESGHLPKYNDECAKAYLNGKIFIALLIEIMIRSADDFFPFGIGWSGVAKSLA